MTKTIRTHVRPHRVSSGALPREKEPAAQPSRLQGDQLDVCAVDALKPRGRVVPVMSGIAWAIVSAPVRWLRFEWRLLNEQNHGPFMGPPELWLDEPGSREAGR